MQYTQHKERSIYHTLDYEGIPITDTHCHLSLLHTRDPHLFAEVLEAQKTEDLFILDIGITPLDFEERQSLCSNFKNIYHTIGMHPCESPHYTPNTLGDILEPIIPAAIAIGEIGLDWYRMYAEKTHQVALFHLQIALAKQYHKPIIIHARESLDDILDIIEKEQLHCSSDMGGIGIMHCFSGNKAQAKRCLDMGFMISFAANISRSSSLETREAAAYIPDFAILTETDSPYILHNTVQKIIKKTNAKIKKDARKCDCSVSQQPLQKLMGDRKSDYLSPNRNYANSTPQVSMQKNRCYCSQCQQSMLLYPSEQPLLPVANSTPKVSMPKNCDCSVSQQPLQKLMGDRQSDYLSPNRNYANSTPQVSMQKVSRENSPLYLFYLLQTLATIRNDTILHIAQLTRKNIMQLLQIPYHN